MMNGHSHDVASIITRRYINRGCVETNIPRVHFACGDITTLEADGLIHYSRPDLQLGAGFGGMIRRRGGQAIQKQLNELAPRQVTEAVHTTGGKLGFAFIVHAVGPDVGEPDAEVTLRRTIVNALALSESLQANHVALPAMGTGFYGVTLDSCVVAMLAAFKTFFNKARQLSEVTICVRDRWMLPAFEMAFGHGLPKGDEQELLFK